MIHSSNRYLNIEYRPRYYLISKNRKKELKSRRRRKTNTCFICFGEPCLCDRIEGYDSKTGVPLVGLTDEDLEYLQLKDETSKNEKAKLIDGEENCPA